MSNRLTLFWNSFQNKNFSEAQTQFDALNEVDKQIVLAELYQKSEYHRKPFMVSVLRGRIHDDKSFQDFYQAWLPEDLCNKVEIHGQVFQQGFPVPVRVINGTHTKDSKEIVSVGIMWASNKEEEQKCLDSLETMSKGDDAVNEIRHDRIKQVADRELLGLFRVATDDNLGTTF